MKIHRFYTGAVKDKSGPLVLDNNLWVHDKALVNQWLNVLRLKVGDKLVLFNDKSERLYQINVIEAPFSVNLKLITEQQRFLPKRHIYLMWGLLKKDKNDWVLQKATELGVRNFVPLMADRSQKTGFNIDRAKKIIIEASEQCGRSDIAEVREPITVKEALAEYKNIDLFVCEQSETVQNHIEINRVGLFIGPEGGWSDNEKQLFITNNLGYLNLNDFTLRAETAAVIAVSKMLQ